MHHSSIIPSSCVMQRCAGRPQSAAPSGCHTARCKRGLDGTCVNLMANAFQHMLDVTRFILQHAFSLSDVTLQLRIIHTASFPQIPQFAGSFFIFFSLLFIRIPSQSHNVSSYFSDFILDFSSAFLWFLICDVFYRWGRCQGGFLQRG